MPSCLLTSVERRGEKLGSGTWLVSEERSLLPPWERSCEKKEKRGTALSAVAERKLQRWTGPSRLALIIPRYTVAAAAQQQLHYYPLCEEASLPFS